MKLFLTLIIAFFVVSVYGQERTPTGYCMVIHGGAGGGFEQMPDSLKLEYHHDLQKALQIGQEILKTGGSALDAVEQTVRFLEDSPRFNAGRGSVLNAEGKVEMDAAIMNGKDLSCGAVASVHSIKNPISLARRVMEKTKHILLTAEGAELFAKKQGVEQMDSAYFITPKRYEDWLKFKSKSGTVGAVAKDIHGNLAAATSTGGMTGKMPGRVGDAPLINCGTYANNQTCAVSCTGIGEKFIKNTIAYRVSALMEYKGWSLDSSATYLLNNVLVHGDGGLIAVDKDGNYTMPFNTTGMFRGVVHSNGTMLTVP